MSDAEGCIWCGRSDCARLDPALEGTEYRFNAITECEEFTRAQLAAVTAERDVALADRDSAELKEHQAVEVIASLRAELDVAVANVDGLLQQLQEARAIVEAGTAFTVGTSGDGTAVAVEYVANAKHWRIQTSLTDIMRDGGRRLPGHYPTRALAWEAALRALDEPVKP